MPRLTAARKRAIDEIIKEAVYEAVVTVLTEYGVEGMTMDRVASAADVAKGSLYKYFRSKQDLLQFVYTRTLDPLFENLTEVLAMEESAEEKLAIHLRLTLQLAAEHIRVFSLLLHDDMAQRLLQSSERSTREAVSQRLAAVFRQGIDDGVFRPADPLVLARAFIGMCVGVFDGHPQLEGRDEQEDIHRLIMGTFLNGIATDKCCVVDR